MKTTVRRQAGFAYIAAIVIVVVLAMLATAAVKLNVTQQTTSNQDLLSARALQAARAGTEIGVYQALHNNCANQLVDMSANNGFWVQVTCVPTTYLEGESAPGTPITKVIFEIGAVACNTATCPGGAAQVATPDYTERRRVVTVCARPNLPGLPLDC